MIILGILFILLEDLPIVLGLFREITVIGILKVGFGEDN